MNVGYFSHKFPSPGTIQTDSNPYGGSVLATYYLVQEIVKKNHIASVFSTSNDNKEQIERMENLIIYRYPRLLDVYSSNFAIDLFRKPLLNDVQIIHVSFDIPPSPLAGYRFAKKKKVPFILTYHGDWDASFGSLPRKIAVSAINHFLVDRILSLADIIISPSEYFSGNSPFLQKYRDKTRIIPNGLAIEAETSRVSKDQARDQLGIYHKNVLLFVGSINSLKRPDILIRALSKVIETNPDILCYFLGNGDISKYRDYAAKLGVRDHVKFTGYIKERKSLYFYASDIFILPSDRECFPLVILEAMSFGIPVIATRVGGIPDLVSEGKNGLLFNPGDWKKLAGYINELLSDEAYSQKLGQGGKESVTEYQWSCIADKTERLYRELLEISGKNKSLTHI